MGASKRLQGKVADFDVRFRGESFVEIGPACHSDALAGEHRRDAVYL